MKSIGFWKALIISGLALGITLYYAGVFVMLIVAVPPVGFLLARGIINGTSNGKRMLDEMILGTEPVDVASYAGMTVRVVQRGEPPVPWLNLSDFCHATGIELKDDMPHRLGKRLAIKAESHGWLIAPGAIPHCAHWLNAMGRHHDAGRLPAWFERQVMSSRRAS